MSMIKERDKYFKEHGITFPNTVSSDGNYHKAVRDITRKGGQKQFKAKDLETLKTKVYVYLTTQKLLGKHSKHTFYSVFENALAAARQVEWLNEAQKVSYERTEQHYRSDFKRFFGHTKLPESPIEMITADMLEIVIRNNIKKQNLRKKAVDATHSLLITDDVKELLELLEGYHERYYPNSEYLFPDKTELGCIDLHKTYRFYQKVCEALDLPISRNEIKGTHCFRRNIATRMANNGAPLTVVADYLGNSPRVLEQNYRLTNRSVNEQRRFLR